MSWLLSYVRSTPHRSFVLYPLAILTVRMFVDRGRPKLDWRFTPLLAWGYLQYRFVGQYRRGQGGGGRGMDTLPDQLITSGPYAYLRNPMYLGHLIFLLGLALVSRLGIAWLLLAANAWWFDQRVRRDERRLDAHFGEPYIRYRQSVPRWLPRPR